MFGLSKYTYSSTVMEEKSYQPQEELKTSSLVFKGFAMSIQGAAHLENDIPLQDASDCKIETDYAIAAIADGHGGVKYIRSQIGSKIAVQCALECLAAFVEEGGETALKNANSRNAERIIRQLEGAVIHKWRKNIKQYHDDNPLTEDEKLRLAELNANVEGEIFTLYGTTLLYAGIVDGFWHISQVGDGQVGIIDWDGEYISPMEEDDRLLCGVTTSLCSNEAANDFRRAYGKNPLRGIVIATDGVSDSYSKETYFEFVRSIVDKFLAQPKETKIALRNWLPTLSERGSRDDMSIGCICISKEEN